MKIPKPILLYLLAMEMLPLLDELNAGNRIKKACRSIEAFSEDCSKTIEEHPELSNLINDDLLQEFSRLIDSIEV